MRTQFVRPKGAQGLVKDFFSRLLFFPLRLEMCCCAGNTVSAAVPLGNTHFAWFVYTSCTFVV